MSTNKVAYITGGTKGIGLGIAAALVKEGYKVAISGRKLEDAQKAAQQIGDTSQIIGLSSNVRHYEDEQKAVESILAHFGRLDIVIANAGVGIFKPVYELSVEDWNTQIETNLSGVFHTLKASAKELINNKGYYITIASLAGAYFFKDGAAYNASKFGVVGFSQAAMLDLRDKDVKVTTILPGSVNTEFFNADPNDEKNAWKMHPDDLGQLVVDILNMHPRTLPSKIEVRPSKTKM